MSKLKGIVNVIKPPEITSFKVVKWIKKNLDVKKAGHTGTLDPKAAGVLPVCLNGATKIIPYLPENEKEYNGELRLGIVTDSLDSEGKVIDRNTDWKNISVKKIKSVFSSFKGNINQIPPMYSAIHHQGKRLYELARKGKKVERKPRRVTIREIKVLAVDLPKVRFKVKCSKGTYIRSLAKDIGEKLGVGAYLTFLLRTCSGPFTLENAYTLTEVKSKTNIIIPLDQPLTYPTLIIKKKAYKRASNGNMLKRDYFKNWPEKLEKGELVSVYDHKGNFISINEIISKPEGIICKPRRVFV